jgi:hypothetical protein
MPHGATEPVLNYGGEQIADQCRVCHSVAAVYGNCAKCDRMGRLSVTKKSRKGLVWLCSDECLVDLNDARRKESAAAKIAKEEAARKKFAEGNR